MKYRVGGNKDSLSLSIMFLVDIYKARRTSQTFQQKNIRIDLLDYTNGPSTPASFGINSALS